MPGGALTNPGWTVVAAQDGVVYSALATGTVVALDSLSGSELWRFPAQTPRQGIGCSLPFASGGTAENTPRPLDAVYGLPILTEDLLLVTSFDSQLYAFDRRSGEKLWTFGVGAAIVDSVTVFDGVAYFGSSDHRVYALDLETQQPAWPAPFETGNWVWSAPAVDQERVYVGSMDHYVYALERTNGREIWRTDVNGSVPGRVTLADGLLFAGSLDRRLYALNKETGEIVWRTEPLGGWVWGEALVHEGYVYFGSLNGQVHALRVADGTYRWGPVTLQGALRAGPALFGDRLVVGTEEGRVYTITLEDGLVEEQPRVKGAVLSTPAVLEDMVYLGTTLGEVHALDFARGIGRHLWQYPPEKD